MKALHNSVTNKVESSEASRSYIYELHIIVREFSAVKALGEWHVTTHMEMPDCYTIVGGGAVE